MPYNQILSLNYCNSLRYNTITIVSSCQYYCNSLLETSHRQLDKGERRLKDLETLFRRSFEELALGHLSNGQFQMLVRGYEQEKAELEAKAETLKDEIANRQDTLLNASANWWTSTRILRS